MTASWAAWPALALLLPATAAPALTEEHAAERALALTSDSSCPSADAVRAALADLRPAAEWPATAVAIRALDDVLWIDMGATGSTRRQLAVGRDCATRAASAALVIAAWMDDLPAEVAGAPLLQAAAAAATAAPAPPATVPPTAAPLPTPPREVGLAVALAAGGGLAPGARVELTRLRPTSSLGWHASLGVVAPRELAVGSGLTRWLRADLLLAVHARRPFEHFFVAAALGTVGAYTVAWGTDYPKNQRDGSWAWGLAAAGRVGVPWRRWRLWTELRVCRWLVDESAQIDAATAAGSLSATLPTWDVQWALGLSYAF